MPRRDRSGARLEVTRREPVAPPVWQPERDGAGSSGADCQLRLRAAEQQHLREGDRLRVCDRQERRSAAHRVEAPLGAARQYQTRRSASAHDLDVAPPHLMRVPSAERLHRRFFRGKPAGKVDRRAMTPLAVGDLALGEHARDEAVAPAGNDVFDAVDVGRVEAKADDVWHML